MQISANPDERKLNQAKVQPPATILFVFMLGNGRNARRSGESRLPIGGTWSGAREGERQSADVLPQRQNGDGHAFQGQSKVRGLYTS